MEGVGDVLEESREELVGLVWCDLDLIQSVEDVLDVRLPCLKNLPAPVFPRVGQEVVDEEHVGSVRDLVEDGESLVEVEV